MELIVIGESRIKIMLTGEDMVHYELAELNAETTAPHTREVLRHIFADAHERIGFDTEGERLFVQLYASKGGGCEIFVTKLGNTGETKLLRLISEEETENTEARERTVILLVKELTDLTALCRRLLAAGFRGNSRLYIPSDGRTVWYLALSLPDTAADLSASPFGFLWEYGTEVSETSLLRLSEQGKTLCSESAVETLARI